MTQKHMSLLKGQLLLGSVQLDPFVESVLPEHLIFPKRPAIHAVRFCKNSRFLKVGYWFLLKIKLTTNQKMHIWLWLKDHHQVLACGWDSVSEVTWKFTWETFWFSECYVSWSSLLSSPVSSSPLPSPPLISPSLFFFVAWWSKLGLRLSSPQPWCHLESLLSCHSSNDPLQWSSVSLSTCDTHGTLTILAGTQVSEGQKLQQSPTTRLYAPSQPWLQRTFKAGLDCIVRACLEKKKYNKQTNKNTFKSFKNLKPVVVVVTFGVGFVPLGHLAGWCGCVHKDLCTTITCTCTLLLLDGACFPQITWTVTTSGSWLSHFSSDLESLLICKLKMSQTCFFWWGLNELISVLFGRVECLSIHCYYY